jgi:hypothetical protein
MTASIARTKGCDRVHNPRIAAKSGCAGGHAPARMLDTG